MSEVPLYGWAPSKVLKAHSTPNSNPLCEHGNPVLLSTPFCRDQRSYLARSALEVVLQKSIPVQLRQRILYISDDKG